MTVALPADPAAMVKMIRARSLERSPFATLLGVELLGAFDGVAEAALTGRADLCQHRGTLHGGVITSVIDNVAGWAATTLLGPVVTTGLSVHFHAPVRDRLRVEGRVVHRTAKTAHVSVTARDDGDGERPLVATATVTLLAVAAES